MLSIAEFRSPNSPMPDLWHRTGMNTLGSSLLAARKKAKLSQTQAGAVAGIGKSHMSKMETDKDRPSVDVLLQLAKLYGVPVRELAGDDIDLSEREVALNLMEVEWLLAFRSMEEAERQGALALIRRR